MNHAVARHAPDTFVGSADHLVSQAFYFTDPEGNGIELYRDRGRDQWQWDDGYVRMASLRLDPNRFLAEHLTEDTAAEPGGAPVVVGHVHLQGRRPRRGPALLRRRPGLRGHRAGAWRAVRRRGRLPPPPRGEHVEQRGRGTAGVVAGPGEVSIHVPTSDDVGALRSRLTHHGVAVADDGATVRFEDPWRKPRAGERGLTDARPERRCGHVGGVGQDVSHA